MMSECKTRFARHVIGEIEENGAGYSWLYNVYYNPKLESTLSENLRYLPMKQDDWYLRFGWLWGVELFRGPSHTKISLTRDEKRRLRELHKAFEIDRKAKQREYDLANKEYEKKMQDWP